MEIFVAVSVSASRLSGLLSMATYKMVDSPRLKVY